jgi:hypothetical protein
MCKDIVPSNSEELWYKDLVVLGTENCKLNFTQSKKEYWVKLNFTFNSPIIDPHELWSGYYSFSSFNLKTNNLLNIYAELTKHAICVTESFSTAMFKKIDNFEFKKIIHFTFSRKSISENCLLIKEEIEKLLIQISTELALIREDNLARGKLIESINLHVSKTPNSQYFHLEKGQFTTLIEELSPVEFWGSLNYVSDNFISGTEFFPWMPIKIAEDNEMPF